MTFLLRCNPAEGYFTYADGTLISTAGGGIFYATFPTGDVEVYAVALAGYTFTEWQGVFNIYGDYSPHLFQPAAYNQGGGEALFLPVIIPPGYWLVQVLNGPGGTVSATELGLVLDGSTIVCTAAPAPSCTFDGWSGTTVSSDNPLTLVVTGNVSLYGTFLQLSEPIKPYVPEVVCDKVSYSYDYTPTNGVPPYAFELFSGVLPPGVSLDPVTGTLSSAGPIALPLTPITANGIPLRVALGSVFDLDHYTPGWQTTPGVPAFIGMAGRNLMCVGPVPDGIYTIDPWLVANMPVQANDTLGSGFVQVDRGALAAILAYAQHIASFKMGGAEFDATTGLYQQCIGAATRQNKRLSAVSFYRQQLQLPGLKAEMEIKRQLP